MKKITLLLLLLQAAFMNAQTPTDTTGILSKKHEVKFGAIKLLAGGIFEGTYEYVKSPYFTYGASILGNFDRNNNDYPEDFSVTPFVRFYFQEAKQYGGRGFFVEGFGKFLTGRDYYEYYEVYEDPNGQIITDWEEHREKYTAGSVGISLGWKWINHSGFVFEILCGAGRNIGGSNAAPEASFRGDFNLGYRF